MTSHASLNGRPEDFIDPHDYDHSHANVTSGWLRAAVFGAMDGLVSNIGLIAGIAAAGAPSRIVALTGISGLIAGAISMALGEYTSVRTQNEQLDYEVRIESEALRRNPEGEELELREQLVELGMTRKTAEYAAAEVHGNHETALKLHLSNELGLSLDERPSPFIAAFSSLAAFGVGALIPVLPYLVGLPSLIWGLVFGGAGLLLAGSFAAKFSRSGIVKNALRQVLFGGIAVLVTYAIGSLLGVANL
ncbi:MAG: VIT1/CCC1 transporter family protein [Canibacter sp.]